MGTKIVFIIIVIVGLGIGLYLYSSGALVNGVQGFNHLIGASSTFSVFDFGSSTVVHGPTAPTGPSSPPQTTISAPPSGSGSTPVNPSEIPAGFTAAQLSPYFHEVRFGGIAPGTLYYYGTITLDDEDYNSSDTIDVTGWQIKAYAGDEYIPQAVNLYDPTGLAPASDILMGDGDVLSLYSSSAPFNLRLNECIGYAAHVANFDPPLPLTCPYVSQTQLESFSGQCQNYLSSLGQCQQPNLSSPQIPQNDYACTEYLENNFTYRSCFDAHSSDANFLSNQIWVWTGTNVVNQYHDSVELLDRNGLLVDVYTY